MTKFMVIALLCILSATISKAAVDKEAILKQLMEYANDCVTEAGAAPSDIDELIKKQPASSKEAKCMRACIMKKTKVMDDNGKYDKSVAIEHAKKFTEDDPEKMKIANEINDICAATVVPDDHCEAAELYGKCLKNEFKSRNIEKLLK